MSSCFPACYVYACGRSGKRRLCPPDSSIPFSHCYHPEPPARSRCTLAYSTTAKWSTKPGTRPAPQFVLTCLIKSAHALRPSTFQENAASTLSPIFKHLHLEEFKSV
eukprot:8469119-Pyramimonas_sp.AAC.1